MNDNNFNNNPYPDGSTEQFEYDLMYPAECIDEHEGDCKGEILPHETLAGGSVMRCEYHSDKAYRRQDGINKRYGLHYR